MKDSYREELKNLLQYVQTQQQRHILETCIQSKTRTEASKKLGITTRAIRSTVKRVREYILPSRKDGTIVGIIGDTHLPYELDGYLSWVQAIFKQNKVNYVIHIGDLFDHHALSFHDSEPALKGAYGEYIDALEHLEPWKRAFPKMTIISGNHDKIPARQIAKLGINPQRWMRPLSQVYEFPAGWSEVEDITIDGVIYHHGHTAVGVNGFRNDAKNRMQNSVSGHAHGNLGVSWTASHHRAVWGMAVGCGIDNTKMAFAYGKHFKNKPMVGCGVVKYGETPLVFAMDLGES